MQPQPIHTSSYGIAVATPPRQPFKLRRVTSVRWREFTGAMARVVDGVRMDGDFESLLAGSPSVALRLSPAGDERRCPAEGWARPRHARA